MISASALKNDKLRNLYQSVIYTPFFREKNKNRNKNTQKTTAMEKAIPKCA